MSDRQRKGARSRGRKQKSQQEARRRVRKLQAEHDVEERQWVELLSLVSELFTEGRTAAEIKQEVLQNYPKSYGRMLQGENLWDLLRDAARREMFLHTPPVDLSLERHLSKEFPWLQGRLTIVQTTASAGLAYHGAMKLLETIRTVRRHQRCNEVHVGFAGGMTLRSVAKSLAELLREPHDDNPKTLVFHAMVAGFVEEDFFADPNSFINYFVELSPVLKVRFVRLPLPGVIHSLENEAFQGIQSVLRVYEQKDRIHIIVTSGGLMSDPHGTLKRYYADAVQRAKSARNPDDEKPSDAKEILKPLNDMDVVGDLLWQPLNAHGPVNAELDYRIATLMELDELPTFIDKGGTVLLILGCSGLSRQPKSALLKTILKIQPRLITDLVADTPTVAGMYVPQGPGE